ncbi:MAG: hypothetical protein ACP5M4_10150 [Acidobacteriaceae bacterium]
MSLLTLALIALFALMAGPAIANAQTKDSAEISRLLNEAKSYAVQANTDAAELESYTNSNLDWKTHAQAIERIRGHVNNMGKLLQQMHDIKSEGTPWQKDAINSIDPLLRQMADHLTAAIKHGNEYPNRVHMMKFKNYVRACASLANQTERLISDIVAYDKAQAKARMLEQKLELPPSGSPESE